MPMPAIMRLHGRAMNHLKRVYSAVRIQPG